VKFLFDNDISPRFALMLRALHVDVVGLREVMPADTKDPDFLGDLRTKHNIDVFISNNTAQRTNAVEAKLLKASGVTSLYFGPFWSRMTFWPQAKWLVNKWETIDNYAGSAAKGSCADIKQNGRMTAFHL
jgi:hypothetical protein